MSANDVLKKDFEEALGRIDFEKPYDPFGKAFMKAFFIGGTLLASSLIDDSDDAQEELDGAEKYMSRYLESGDAQYKEMACDELRHAGILIKKRLSKAADEKEKERLCRHEKKRQEMLKEISSSAAKE